MRMHNRRLRSDLDFLLKSSAGKDTEGQLDRRNDQRPRRLQQEDEEEREGGDTYAPRVGARVYCTLGMDLFSPVGNSLILRFLLPFPR